MPLELMENTRTKNNIQYTQYGTSFLTHCYTCGKAIEDPPLYRHICILCGHSMAYDKRKRLWERARVEHPELNR